MARKLRVGDRINCRDGSYCFGIKDGEYCSHISNINSDRDNLKIVSVGIAAKEKYIFQGNDTGQYCDILATDGHGDFWFLQSNTCKLIPQMHTIKLDGKEIEISDESFENLKKQLCG